MATIADISDLKLLLGIPIDSDKEDDRLLAILAACEAEVLAYLGLDSCDPTSYTLSADVPCRGRPLDVLRIGIPAVISITEVKNGSAVLTVDDDYVCRDGWIRLCCGYWCCGCQSATITVVAGFDPTDPQSALRLAAIKGGLVDYAAARYARAGSAGLRSETIGRYRYEVLTSSDRQGVNGFGHWPATLSAALLSYWRPTNATEFSREC